LSQTPIKIYAVLREDYNRENSNFNGFGRNGFHAAQQLMRRAMCPYLAKQETEKKEEKKE